MDPVGAILQALAEWLEGQDGISLALRGWPEREEDLDLSGGPVVSVVAVGDGTIDWYPPVPLLETATDDGDLEMVWGLADLRLRVQLDLWCPYRAVRDQMVGKLNAAFHDDLPWSTGLELTVAAYPAGLSDAARATYAHKASVIPRTTTPQDDDQAVTTREWRQRWELEVGMDLAAVGRTPKQALITLQTTTTLKGLDVVEPDFTIPED